MKVWVVDSVGYDARGGHAELFSTLEKAKAAYPWVEWIQTGDEEWEQKLSPHSTADLYVIEAKEVDAE